MSPAPTLSHAARGDDTELSRNSGDGPAGDSFAQAFQQAFQVRHALPEFSAFAGCFTKLRPNGSGLDQDQSPQGDDYRNDDGQELFVSHSTSERQA